MWHDLQKDILEEFAVQSVRSDRLTEEASWYKRYLYRKLSIKEAVRRWRSFPANRQKYLAWAREYWTRPSVKERVAKHMASIYADPVKYRHYRNLQNAAQVRYRDRQRAKAGRPKERYTMTAETIGRMSSDRATGMTLQALGRKYGKSKSQVWKLLNGQAAYVR